jgi:pyruvate kinase
MLARIACAAEPLLAQRPLGAAPDAPPTGLHPITAAVVYGAGHIARQLAARLVIVASHSGATALALSQQRGAAPIVGASDAPATLRRMTLLWGVYPLAEAPTTDAAALMTLVEAWGLRDGYLRSGDRVLFVRGTNLDAPVHNLTVVHQVE